LDSLTQIVLGAAVGEAVGGRKLGLKAAFWGAIAGTIPDLDVFFNAFYHPIEAALVHRGFSHSILFALLFSPLFAWLVHCLYRKKYTYKMWLYLFFFGIITHPLLDVFTNYGTSLLWPFPARLALDSVFVVDPLYTVPFLICLIVAISMRRDAKWRSRINWIGISVSTIYLVWGLVWQLSFLYRSKEYFAQSGVEVYRTYVTAMPLTTFYWELVGEEKDNYYIAYKSIFGKYKPEDIEKIPKNHHLLDQIQWKETEKHFPDLLKFISKGFYAVQQHDKTVYVYDLRFCTTTKLTAGKSSTPIFCFAIELDKDQQAKKVSQVRSTRNAPQIDLKSYWNYIFAKE